MGEEQGRGVGTLWQLVVQVCNLSLTDTSAEGGGSGSVIHAPIHSHIFATVVAIMYKFPRQSVIGMFR